MFKILSSIQTKFLIERVWSAMKITLSSELSYKEGSNRGNSKKNLGLFNKKMIIAFNLKAKLICLIFHF